MYAGVTLIGNLGRDVSMRYLPDGKAVSDFAIATSSKEKVEGEYKEVATWWNIKVFGAQAENCNKYLSKGKRVLVHGKPVLRKYTKKDGTEGSSLEVIATDVVFLSPKDASSDGQTETVGATSDDFNSETEPF